MQLGISSYTYVWSAGVPGYDQPRTRLTVRKLLDFAASLDVDVVQAANNLPLDEAGAERLRSSQFVVELGTSGIWPEDLLPYLTWCERAGSSLLRTVLDGKTHFPSPEESVALLRDIIPAFERAGVTLAIENQDRFSAHVLRDIVERVGSPSAGVCLDTANSLGCGQGLAEVLPVLAPVTVNLHVKDFRVRRLPHNQGFIVEGAPAWQGLADVPRILEALDHTGRDFNAIVELWPPPAESIDESILREEEWAAESVRYMRTLIPKTAKHSKEYTR